jgi:F-type H+-transporting ATPase subunit epsilon
MTIEIRVLTPSNIIYDGKVTELILPTTNGRVGILAQHSAYTTIIDIGLLAFREVASDKWSAIALIGGYASVESDRLTIWASEAHSYSSDRAALQKAKKLVEEAESMITASVTERDIVEAKLSFRRANLLYTLYKTTEA